MKNEDTGNAVQQQPSEQSANIPSPIDQPSCIPTDTVGSNCDKQNVSNLEYRLNGPEKWMIYLTAAIVFVSLCGVAVAYLQWNAMRGQLDEMRSQFQRDQRPYVMPVKVEPYLTPGQPIMVNLRWVNYGKSPAIKARARGAILFGANALGMADEWFAVEAPKPLTFAPERIVPPGTPANLMDAEFSTFFSNRIVSQEEYDFLSRTDFSIVVVIRQEYFDGAGNRYWTDSCFSNLGGKAIPDCPRHNEIH